MFMIICNHLQLHCNWLPPDLPDAFFFMIFQHCFMIVFEHDWGVSHQISPILGFVTARGGAATCGSGCLGLVYTKSWVSLLHRLLMVVDHPHHLPPLVWHHHHHYPPFWPDCIRTLIVTSDPLWHNLGSCISHGKFWRPLPHISTRGKPALKPAQSSPNSRTSNNLIAAWIPLLHFLPLPDLPTPTHHNPREDNVIVRRYRQDIEAIGYHNWF